MTGFTPLAGTAGGLLIALSAVLLMGGFGRVAGLSGIFAGLLRGSFGAEFAWRGIFILGVLAGAAAAAALGAFDPRTIGFAGGPATTIAGGLLVGAGTSLASGCTSGHGICGLARLSARSLAATGMFMAVAVLTVFVIRHILAGA